MKIIDLLIKISNGEEVPNMIKYDGNIYYKKRNVYKHTNYYESEYNNLLLADIRNSNQLNDEVEIIEEDNEIEYLHFHDLIGITENEKILICKFNEIITYINKKENKNE